MNVVIAITVAVVEIITLVNLCNDKKARIMSLFDLFTNRPAKYEGYLIDYESPDGDCKYCGNTIYKTIEAPCFRFCPICKCFFLRLVESDVLIQVDPKNVKL